MSWVRRLKSLQTSGLYTIKATEIAVGLALTVLTAVTVGGQDVDRLEFGRSGAWQVWGRPGEPRYCAAAMGTASDRFGIKITSTRTTIGIISSSWKLDVTNVDLEVEFTVDGNLVMHSKADVVSPRALSATVSNDQFAWKIFLGAKTWMTIDFGKGLLVLNPQSPAPIEALLNECAIQLLPNASAPWRRK